MDSSLLDPIFITFEQFSQALREFLPTLIFAFAVLIFGLMMAWAFKALVLRIGAALSPIFRGFTGRHTTGTVRLPLPLSTISAHAVFWLTVAFFIAVTARILGLPGIADWLAAIASYLPTFLTAAAIILFGYLIATFVRDSIARYGDVTQDRQFTPLAGLLFYVINMIALLAALRQLGIDLVLVRSLILIGFGALVGGVALAFGLGARASLDNLIAGYYTRKYYQRGQRLRIGALEGDVIEITPTSLVVATANGRAMIPARKFNEDVSILLGREGDEHE